MVCTCHFLKRLKLKKKKKKKVAIDLWQWHCRNRREKNLLQWVCGNDIAETIQKKKIVTMALSKFIPLPNLCPWSALVGVPEWFTNCGNQVVEIVENWGERKYELWQPSCWKWEELKKKCYIHNIFTIFSQQITDD